MMATNLKINTLASIIICLLPRSAFSQSAQHFKYRADIGKVDSSGVYKIELRPDLVAKCTDKHLYDIRIVDEAGKFWAYSIQPRKDVGVPHFIDLPEVKRNTIADTNTVYIADAGTSTTLNELWLKLKNTDVTRQASLSGSDDMQHWFAIKENIELQGANEGTEPEYEQMLSFPASKYRYFRIEINNKNRDPIKIIQSGIYPASRKSPGFVISVPPPKLRVKNGHRQTSYFVSFNGNYQINGLKLYVSSPTYYHRQIAVYDLDHRPEEKLCNDSISSSGEPGNGISLSCKISKLRIDINNGDDNPIVIDSISAWQVQQYAISYLEKGHRYYLLTGDSSADEVSYDLSFLHSRPMAKFPVINYSAVYKNPLFAIQQFPGRRNYTVLIWIAITIVLLLLGLLTWRMVNEINQKPKI